MKKEQAIVARPFATAVPGTAVVDPQDAFICWWLLSVQEVFSFLTEPREQRRPTVCMAQFLNTKEARPDIRASTASVQVVVVPCGR